MEKNILALFGRQDKKTSPELKELHVALAEERMNISLRRSPRARRVRAVVYPGGKIEVVLPLRMSSEGIESFIRHHARWILQSVKKLRKVEPRIPLPGDKKSYQQEKDRVQQFVAGRVHHFSQLYGIWPSRIVVRNQKSRWGSCSAKKTLTFNFRIMYLPHVLQDYIVVHELCHLREMNHSSSFWNLVERTIPEYKVLKKELRKYSFS
ncbi:MAG: hypothetical protein RIQ56_689 [Candidatus Parcubacteria bacterium]